MRHFSKPTTVLAACAFIPSVLANACPPLGAVLPPPQAPSLNEAVQSAVKNLKSTLDLNFSSQLNSSGISLAVKSIHEDTPIFSYHFTPSVLSGIGTKAIDDDTIFRVGSLSKLFPALAALQTTSINMNDLVIKYIPELKNAEIGDVDSTPWDDITVDSLMTQLSGISTDMAMDLGIFPISLWEKIGFPAIPEGTGPNCSGLPGTVPCTKEDLISEINRREPVYLPYTSPSYSNNGFALLGMVIEAAVNKTYTDVIQSGIFNAANMNSSSFNGFVPSFLEKGFVPIGETTWNVTLGVFEGAGGMFSTVSDQIAFAEGILTNRFLSPRRTREWLKPRSHTSSWGYSVGAPWEILRSNEITADGRIVDLYTKSGDLGLYHAFLGLIPDYDLVVSVFTAGSEVTSDMTSEIFSTIVGELVPAVEKAGRAEANASSSGLVGTYTDEATNSSITLSIDSGPGLVIKELIVRSFDVLHHPDLYSLDALSADEDSLPNGVYVNGRMYPTNLVSQNNNGTKRAAWRAVYDTTTAKEESSEDAKLVFKDGSCQSWVELDRAAYNFLSVGDFTFIYGQNGGLKQIANAAFNVTLTKASSSSGKNAMSNWCLKQT